MADGVSVKFEGAKLLRRKYSALPKAVRKAANSAVTRSAREHADEMRRLIKQTSGSWEFYPPSHWSSPPGTPPNNWTGELLRSIKVSKRASLSRGAFSESTVSAPYAVYLEFGTRKMAARPFIQPAFNTVLPMAKRFTREAVKEAQNQVARKGRS